jgi:hypothetical protein
LGAGCARHAQPDTSAAQRDTRGADTRTNHASRCAECRAKFCTNYLGDSPKVDLAAGCLQAPDLGIVKNPDAAFVQQCSAAVKCGVEHHCAYDPARGAAGCYCGSESLDDCAERGPAADAPCAKQWMTAAHASTNQEVMVRFSDMSFPSGWAMFLLECDRDHCDGSNGAGDCTH